MNESNEKSLTFFSLLKIALSILDIGLPVFCSQDFIEVTEPESPSISPLTVPSLKINYHLDQKYEMVLIIHGSF